MMSCVSIEVIRNNKKNPPAIRRPEENISEMEKPLISFCLFAYRQEDYIEQAIRYAFAQTYSPLEIVLSDDHSPDRTFEIMRKMTENYSGPHRIVLNQNPVNLGLVEHINHVVTQCATGELLVAAAGDDWSAPERVETIFRKWDEGGREAYSIFSGTTVVDESGTQTIRTERPQDLGFPTGPVQISCAAYIKQLGIYTPGATQAFHRDVFTRFGTLDITQKAEDRNIAMRAMILGKVLLIDDLLVFYRKNQSSISYSDNMLQFIKKTVDYMVPVCDQAIADLDSEVARRRFSAAEITDIKKGLQKQKAFFLNKQIVFELRGKAQWRALFELIPVSPVLHSLRYLLWIISPSLFYYLQNLKTKRRRQQ